MKTEIRNALEQIFENNIEVLADEVIINKRAKLETVLKASESYSNEEIITMIDKLYKIEFEDHLNYPTFWEKLKKELDQDNLDLTDVKFKVNMDDAVREYNANFDSKEYVELDNYDNFIENHVCYLRDAIQNEIDYCKDQFIAELKRVIDQEINAFEE